MARSRAASALDYPEHLNPFRDDDDGDDDDDDAAADASPAAPVSCPPAAAPRKGGKFGTLSRLKRRASYSSAWSALTLRKPKASEVDPSDSPRVPRSQSAYSQSQPPSPPARRRLFPDLTWLPRRRRTSRSQDSERSRSASLLPSPDRAPAARRSPDACDPETFVITPRTHRYRAPSLSPEEEARMVADRLYGSHARLHPHDSDRRYRSASFTPSSSADSRMDGGGGGSVHRDADSDERFAQEVRRYIFPTNGTDADLPSPPPTPPQLRREKSPPQTSRSAADRLIMERLYIEEPEVEFRRKTQPAPTTPTGRMSPETVNGDADSPFGTMKTRPPRPPRTKKRRAPPPPVAALGIAAAAVAVESTLPSAPPTPPTPPPEEPPLPPIPPPQVTLHPQPQEETGPSVLPETAVPSDDTVTEVQVEQSVPIADIPGKEGEAPEVPDSPSETTASPTVETRLSPSPSPPPVQPVQDPSPPPVSPVQDPSPPPVPPVQAPSTPPSEEVLSEPSKAEMLESEYEISLPTLVLTPPEHEADSTQNGSGKEETAQHTQVTCTLAVDEQEDKNTSQDTNVEEDKIVPNQDHGDTTSCSYSSSSNDVSLDEGSITDLLEGSTVATLPDDEVAAGKPVEINNENSCTSLVKNEKSENGPMVPEDIPQAPPRKPSTKPRTKIGLLCA